MVVSQLDLERSAILPAKTDSPLVIDANAVLPFPVPSQAL
jgi:hypothetical protein